MELPDLAGNIRAELARRRKTQAELRERLGISRQSLRRSLLGERPFQANEIAIAADFLGVEVGDLYRNHTEVSA